MPRFRIALIMLIVAIAALDLGAIRAISDFESRFLFLLCVVTLPMANILAVGLLLTFLRPRRRHFLRGFEVFGAMALALFVVLAMRAEGLVQFYLIPPHGPLWSDHRTAASHQAELALLPATCWLLLPLALGDLAAVGLRPNGRFPLPEV